jgi:hypothetical protein
MNEAQRRNEFLNLVRNRMDPALRGADYDRCFNAVRAERPDLLDNRAAPTLAIANSFDPSQPRDENGRWTDTGALSGSEKQVAWAEQIRTGMGKQHEAAYSRTREYLKRRIASAEAAHAAPDHDEYTEQDVALAKAALRTHEQLPKLTAEASGGKASWWIDQRGKVNTIHATATPDYDSLILGSSMYGKSKWKKTRFLKGDVLQDASGNPINPFRDDV